MYQRMKGMPNWPQILRASRLSISPCRGTGALALFAGFKNRVATAFPCDSTSVPPQMVQKFVSLHVDKVPAWMDNGTSSMRSASALCVS